MKQIRNARIVRASRLGLVVALGLGLAACGGGDEQAPAAAGPAAQQAAKPAATPATVISSQVASMTPEQLREAASKAYNENRLYAPAGDNAMEYYLALRDKTPGDAAVSSALIDLLPMTVIATEQSVARDDFTEAQRLSALIEKADGQHPALSRLKSAIVAQQQAASARAVQQQLTAEEEAKRQAELEKQRLADQQKQQQEARQLAERQAAERQVAERQAAERQAAERQAAERQAAERQAAERTAPPAAQTAAAPARPAAPAANTELRALSTPAPTFPTEALRSAQSGEVQVEFTVAPDGSVSAARVVRSTPPRVFDRAAVNAVRRWRFQPVDAPVTTRRVISFNAGT